jgi:hypothetical protein
MNAFWNWFLHFIGVRWGGPTSDAYNLWSGFGSDLGEVTILAGLIAMYRKHNCHTKGCWRIAKHPVEGTPYIVCKKCHPDMPEGDLTKEHIRSKFLKAKATKTQS